MDNGASSYHRFLKGDESALEEIVSQYRPGLQNYINSIVNNFSVAEDLTEETFAIELNFDDEGMLSSTYKG